MEGTSSSLRGERRACLARDTAAYYESLTFEAMEEENSIGESIAKASAGIDFDLES